MQRASYRAAIRWIAENDSAGDDDANDPVVVAELITSVLVADLFGVTAERVGVDVVRVRAQEAL